MYQYYKFMSFVFNSNHAHMAKGILHEGINSGVIIFFGNRESTIPAKIHLYKHPRLLDLVAFSYYTHTISMCVITMQDVCVYMCLYTYGS